MTLLGLCIVCLVHLTCVQGCCASGRSATTRRFFLLRWSPVFDIGVVPLDSRLG